MQNIPPWIAPVLVLIVITMVAVALIIRSVRERKKRVAALREAIGGLGLEMQDKADKDFVKAWSAIKPLSKGGKAEHVLWGELRNALAFTAFQHTFVVHTGKSAHVVVHSVYAVDTPAWPTLSVTRANALSRWLTGLSAGRGLRNKAADGPFEENWKVKADNQPFADTLLTPHIRDTLASLPWCTSLWFVGGKMALIAKRRLSPEDLSSATAALEQLWEHIPHPALEPWAAARE